MKRALNLLDRYLYGRIALVGAVAGTVLLLVAIFRPLPWQHFPNVLRMFSSSWLYLAIAGGLVASALGSVARAPGFPHTMLACVIVGFLWKYTPLLNFLPFQFGRLLIIYGLAGLVGHCVRRIRSRSSLITETPFQNVAPIPIASEKPPSACSASASQQRPPPTQ